MKVKRIKNLAGLFVFLCVVAAGWFWYELQPVTGTGSLIVKIPSGESTLAISTILEKNRLIRNAEVFRIYLWWTGQASKLEAGTYQFNRGASISSIIAEMAQGKTIPDTVRFTIPEGFTVEQIADRLSQEGLVNKTDFMNEIDHGKFDSQLLADIPANAPLIHRLEGYLFPSTYEIYKGASAHQIIQIMLDRMQQEITPGIIDKWKKEGLTVHQGLTLASLVEREAKVPKERPEIAQVILNRLNAKPPMRIQIDATIQYVVGQKPELTYQDTQINSPYNTYLHSGLPPGPIACPGDASIQASSNPEKNDYLYYVTKKDGSGEHYFAKTYAEQEANYEKSLQNASTAGSH